VPPLGAAELPLDPWPEDPLLDVCGETEVPALWDALPLPPPELTDRGAGEAFAGAAAGFESRAGLLSAYNDGPAKNSKAMSAIRNLPENRVRTPRMFIENLLRSISRAEARRPAAPRHLSVGESDFRSLRVATSSSSDLGPSPS